jgi:hypothetical protein
MNLRRATDDQGLRRCKSVAPRIFGCPRSATSSQPFLAPALPPKIGVEFDKHVSRGTDDA